MKKLLVFLWAILILAFSVPIYSMPEAAMDTAWNLTAALLRPGVTIEDYDKAIRLDPNNVYAYNNRGNAYFNLGLYQQAIEDFSQAVRVDSNHFDAYYNRGNAYLNLGLYQRAIEDYSQS